MIDLRSIRQVHGYAPLGRHENNWVLLGSDGVIVEMPVKDIGYIADVKSVNRDIINYTDGKHIYNAIHRPGGWKVEIAGEAGQTVTYHLDRLSATIHSGQNVTLRKSRSKICLTKDEIEFIRTLI
jgi:hypothetical protein